MRRPFDDTHILAPQPPPRRNRLTFPRTWRDAAYAAATLVLLACASVPLALTWVILGRHL